ncbi:CTP synthase 1-B-like [Lingula anatina]|uniref:CTP synthase n=1 Tax=Lingula anatina TaxID=7574 RepID=A0A1S3HH83_LINAN|nr:CTP synthase 1-B-like [Lingula anatina]|eukprot:XP_013385443.1 CTP synthase 1-B-like [Lingula anatina]
MPFVEAFRQFQFRAKRENFCNIHVSLVPSPKTTGEQKTKPTQNSVRELRGLGLSPDLIAARSTSKLSQSVIDKLSMFCQVAPQQVIGVHDVTNLYRVPLQLEEQNLLPYFRKRLHLPIPDPVPRKLLLSWRELAERCDRLHKEVTIALVGKYTDLEDSYASVLKALQHSALAVNHKLKVKYIEASDLEQSTQHDHPVKYHEAWQNLCSSDGVLVPGGFGVRGVEGKMMASNWARRMNKPFLGVCLGLQCAVIEFCRNVVGWKDANSTEFDKNTTHPVVIEMPEHNPGHMGGTMRLGKRRTEFVEQSSILKKLYGNPDYVEERHRHRYEVNPSLVSEMENHGLKFVGRDVEGQRMEILELKDHPYFVAVQYHPEYISRPLKPSPPYLGLLLASVGKLQSYIARGCRSSPRSLYCDESDSISDDDELVTLVEKASLKSDQL